MKTIVFQFQHQGIGLPEEVEKLLTNYKNYKSLDLKMILNYLWKKIENEKIK